MSSSTAVPLSDPDVKLPSLSEPTTAPRCARCDGALETTPTSLSRPGLGLLAQLRCPDCGDRTWWRRYDAYALVDQNFTP